MFIKVNETLVNSRHIIKVTMTTRADRTLDVEVIFLNHNTVNVLKASGQQATDIVMRLCPSAIEGANLRHAKRSWSFHNLVAHPVMQIMSWLGRTDLGLKIHDQSVPSPLPVSRPMSRTRIVMSDRAAQILYDDD